MFALGAPTGDCGARQPDRWPWGHGRNKLRRCWRAPQNVLQHAWRWITPLSWQTELGELCQGCHASLQGYKILGFTQHLKPFDLVCVKILPPFFLSPPKHFLNSLTHSPYGLVGCRDVMVNAWASGISSTCDLLLYESGFGSCSQSISWRCPSRTSSSCRFPSTVPCKMVLDKELCFVSWPDQASLQHFTIESTDSCCPASAVTNKPSLYSICVPSSL